MDLTMDACKRLGQTLRHLAAIAEHTTEGIVVVDPNGNLQFTNRAWTELHGYPITDGFVGQHIGVFHTEEQMKTAVIPFLDWNVPLPMTLGLNRTFCGCGILVIETRNNHRPPDNKTASSESKQEYGFAFGHEGGVRRPSGKSPSNPEPVGSG